MSATTTITPEAAAAAARDMQLPEHVVGLSTERWRLLRAYAVQTEGGKREGKPEELTSYDFKQICSEELAERRVVIRHKAGFVDPLWKEKAPIDAGVMSKAFGRHFSRAGSGTTLGTGTKPFYDKHFDMTDQEGVYYPRGVLSFETERCVIQHQHGFTKFHIDEAGGSCRVPAGLKAIKIWLIIPCRTYVTRAWQARVDAVKRCKDEPEAIEATMAIAERGEVEVVICQPGDTMIFRPCDAHSVFTVFAKGTPASEQWAILNGQTWISRPDLAAGMKVMRSMGAKSDGDYHVARMYREAIRHFEPRYQFPRGAPFREQVLHYALARGLVDKRKSEAASSKKVKRLAKLNNFSGR